MAGNLNYSQFFFDIFLKLRKIKIKIDKKGEKFEFFVTKGNLTFKIVFDVNVFDK